MKNLQANASYSVFHATMWGIHAVIMSFAANFLASQNLQDYQISIVLGLAAALSCVLQVVIGELVSRIPKLKLYMVTLIIGSIMFLSMGAMLLDHPVAVVGGVTIACTLLQLVPGLCNSLGMDAVAHGAPVTYSIARGIGSLFYALSACFIGVLVDLKGEITIPLVSMILCLGLLGSVVWFHRCVECKLPQQDPQVKTGKEKSDGFLSKNPKFALFLLGAILLCISHMMLCTFMRNIVEAKNGSSTEQGIATGISAFVELPIMFGFVLISKKIRCDVLLRVAVVMFLAKSLGLYFADSPMGVYAAQATQMVGYGLYAITSVTYAGKIFGKKEAVRAQSYLAAAVPAGSVIAMSTGGVICQLFGVQTMILVTAACALAGALIILFCTEKAE